MSQKLLDEREFELVNIVGAKLAVNQRDLSRRMNVSLGMTNMLLRRLVAKGYIRIQQLNQRKVQYLLTPKGFSEKMKKSVKYTLKTIDSIGLIRKQLNTIISRLYEDGERVFFILGTSDLAELVEISLRQPQWSGVTFSRGDEIPEPCAATVIVCRERTSKPSVSSVRYVDLIEELAKGEALWV
jgi:DNA-binding MarR family transcriptional regulator